jgi:alcohol dehydrogenase class IV
MAAGSGVPRLQEDTVVNRILLPRELRIGAGASAQLGVLLHAQQLRRPLVVTDRFSDVEPDPSTDCVDKAATLIRNGEFDCVIGFGGGSSLDTAKAAALVGRTGRPMREYRAPIITDDGALPIVAVPTTAGSGSECTQFTVITDSATRRLTADTGLDALTHALEAYVSRKANPFSDGLAIAAMTRIYQHIGQAYREPDNRTARAEMMLGSTQAGMAFSNSSVALVHGMSRPIGGHFGVAHGLSNAMLLPAVTEFSSPSAPDRYARCARAMGVAAEDDSDVTACRRLVTALHELNDRLAVPGPSSCRIAEDDWFSHIPTMAEQALASGSPSNNPRVPSHEEIDSLYRVIWR